MSSRDRRNILQIAEVYYPNVENLSDVVSLQPGPQHPDPYPECLDLTYIHYTDHSRALVQIAREYSPSYLVSSGLANVLRHLLQTIAREADQTTEYIRGVLTKNMRVCGILSRSDASDYPVMPREDAINLVWPPGAQYIDEFDKHMSQN